jgi:hypothetical protein
MPFTQETTVIVAILLAYTIWERCHGGMIIYEREDQHDENNLIMQLLIVLPIERRYMYSHTKVTQGARYTKTA